jgi:ATP-dependent DNA helicase RecG
MPSVAIDQALNLPAEHIGQALLDAREDQWFDRKSARVKARSLADVLIGFANADGGIVAVGLSAGRVEGIASIGGAINELQQTAIDFTVPQVAATTRLVPCVRSDGEPDQLLIFDVRPGTNVVHANARDEVYLRVGDVTRRLSFAQRQELQFDRGHDSYEARLLDVSETDLDAALISSYVAATGASSAAGLLQARGLATEGRMTVAGCLLFATHPQRWLPEAFVRVLRYRGSDRGSGERQQLIADDRFEGPIPRVLLDARSRIAELAPARRALTRAGRFSDVPIVPEDAWLEGLVNAVVHRSYSLAGDHIRVDIFDDRMEIHSPGRFPGIVDLTDPRVAPRFARNPRIARVCSDLHFGQELGEGIRRIFEEMHLAGLQEPRYNQSAASVRLTLSGEPVQAALDEAFTPDARAVSGALRDAGRLSTGEVAELLGRSRPHASKVLKSLQEAGLIRRVGKSPKDPRAYWEIIPT